MEHDSDGRVVGPTTLSNLASLCRRHHRFVHEEGFHVERRADGEPQCRDRNGWVIPEAPQLPQVPAAAAASVHLDANTLW